MATSSDQLAVAMVVCVECGEKTEGDAQPNRSFRCTDCNSLKSRLHRLFAKNGNDESSVKWKDMPKEERMNFFRESHALMGLDLAAAVDEVISKTATSDKERGFKGEGQFYDEIDIREMYKSKPDQAASVLANARKIFDPIRKVFLYEDMKYTATISTTDRTSELRSQTVKQVETLKKKAPEKKDVVATKFKTRADKISHVTTSGLEQIKELTDTVSKNELQIAGEAMGKIERLTHKLHAFQAEVGIAIENDTGDIEEFHNSMMKNKAEVKHEVGLFKLQIKAAMSLKGIAETQKARPRGTKRTAAEK